MVFNIQIMIFLFFLFFICCIFINNYFWLKIHSLILSFSLYMIVLISFLFFDSLTTQFQFIHYLFLDLSFMEFSVVYGLDGISMVFLLLVSIIMPLVIIINWEQSLFPKFLLINILFLEFCLLHLFSVLDIFFFFFFFEASLIPMFFMIGIFGSSQRKKKAALLFFFYSLFGSFFLLFAIFMMFFETGSSNFAVILNFNYSILKQKILWICFFISFGSKFPLYPFHIWLPEAHVEAPTSGSIMLAAILLKIGAYGVLSFMLTMLPQANLFFNSFVCVMSLMTIFLASWVAFSQVDTKKIIAYSSISHMGLGFLGLFSNNIYGLMGSMFLMICHGFVSSGLFLIAGLLYERFYTSHMYEYGGLCTTMPIFTFFFFMFTLANIGLPGFGNFISEILLLYGIFLKKDILVIFIMFIGLLITVMYSFWLYSSIVFGTLKLFNLQEMSLLSLKKKKKKVLISYQNILYSNLYQKSYLDLNSREFFVLAMLLMLLLLLGFYPQFLFKYIYACLSMLLL